MASGGSFGNTGTSGSGNSGGDSGDASLGSGGTAGADGGGGTAGADSGGGTAGANDGGGTAGANDGGGTAGANDGGGTAGADSGVGDSSVLEGGDGGPCPAGCPAGAPVCSTGECRKVKQIVPGGAGYLCALIEDGTVRCWGNNDKGQLGDGSRTSRSKPGPALRGLSDVVQLNAGFDHTCAVTGGGSVWCWGENYYGQLGFTGVTTIPVEVQNLGDFAEQVTCHGISAGYGGQSCARMSSGRVKCWGSNFHGQLGNGTRGDASAVPVEVLNLTDAAQIGMSGVAVCAVRDTGKVVCWGYNGYDVKGRLGTGSTEEFISSPEEVIGLSEVRMIDGGDGNFCAVAGPERHVKCWGQDLGGVLGDGAPHDNGTAISPVLAVPYASQEVRAGWRTTCARLQNNDVSCWGFNVNGMLGNGNSTDTNAMTTRTLLAAPAVSIEFRWTLGCAILDDGRVQCWPPNPNISVDGGSSQVVPGYVVW